MRALFIKYFRRSLLLVLLFMGSCSPAAQEIDSLFRYINDVRQELRGNQSEEKKQKLLNKTRSRLLTLIDTEYVARLSLGKHYDSLSPSEKKEFIALFHELLAYNLVKTYIPIHAVTDESTLVELVSEEMKKDVSFNTEAVIIHTKLTSKSVVYNIDFYLHLLGKKYKLYDVHVDGASVLLDYQNQFYSIVASKGYPYLFQRLKEKFKQLQTG